MSLIFSTFSLPPLASGSLYYAFDHSDLMGQGIVILLTLMSIATWTLMLEKGNKLVCWNEDCGAVVEKKEN